MSNSSHKPNYVKYVLGASDPHTRTQMIEQTRFDGPNGCWEWQGLTNETGYGFLATHSFGNLLVHRVALHLVKRPVPEDRVVDHLCRNHACVNPAHLEIVTHVENVMRGNGYYAVNARKTHCPQGHEYTEENTRVYVRPGATNPGRYCKQCARDRIAAKRAAA